MSTRPNIGWLAFTVMLTLAVSACAPMQTRELYEQRDELNLPARASVEGVPFIPQEERYCGPATLAMALQYMNFPVSQDEAGKTIYTPGRAGTLRADMMGGARRFGAMAVRVSTLKDLFDEVAAGHPVIVFQNLALDAYPIWHYALLTGYDLDRENVVLNSATIENKVVDISTFEHTWARGEYWAIVLTPPGQLPVTADHDEAMQAAVALERVSRHEDALKAYGSVRQKWPDSFPAAMGAGNTSFALGNYVDAQNAFEDATKLKPNAPQAWNNLAYTLRRLGQKDAAIAAVERAITLAATDKAQYESSLEELRR